MLIRKATLNDLALFYPHSDDIAEAEAAGIDWFENITGAVLKGCVVMIHRGKALAVGGNEGDMVWFVTSNTIDRLTRKERLEFRKEILTYRDKMLEGYPFLFNYVHVKNQNHRRFLKTIGAEFQQEFAESPTTREQFQLFVIRKQEV